MTNDNTALLIGCTAENEQILARCLEREGYRIEAQQSWQALVGQTAVKRAALVVLDATPHPPDEVCRSISDLQSRVPNVLLLCVCSCDSRSAISTVLRFDNSEFVLAPLREEDIRHRLSRHARQKHVHDQLEDGMRFIRRVADTTPELIYLFDVEANCNVYVNCRVCELLGCTPEGIPADGRVFFASVMHADDLPLIKARLEHQFRIEEDGTFASAEYRIKDAKGEWRWLRTRETVFGRTRSGAVKQILGTGQDVTDRRALEETRAHLASIVQHTDDAVIGKNLDGTIVSWNAAAERTYGYMADEAIGQNISMIVPPGLEDEIPRLLDTIGSGQRVDHYVTTRKRRDGTLIRASVTISPIRNALGQITGASTIARQVDD